MSIFYVIMHFTRRRSTSILMEQMMRSASMLFIVGGVMIAYVIIRNTIASLAVVLV